MKAITLLVIIEQLLLVKMQSNEVQDFFFLQEELSPFFLFLSEKQKPKRENEWSGPKHFAFDVNAVLKFNWPCATAMTAMEKKLLYQLQSGPFSWIFHIILQMSFLLPISSRSSNFSSLFRRRRKITHCGSYALCLKSLSIFVAAGGILSSATDKENTAICGDEPKSKEFIKTCLYCSRKSSKRSLAHWFAVCCCGLFFKCAELSAFSPWL